MKDPLDISIHAEFDPTTGRIVSLGMNAPMERQVQCLRALKLATDTVLNYEAPEKPLVEAAPAGALLDLNGRRPTA